MATHVNFYERLEEARMRLRNTVVLYDGEPHYVIAITGHKPDGIFRIYMEPLSETPAYSHDSTIPSIAYGQDHPSLGAHMDAWLEGPDGKRSNVVRKMMNSPLFNKFRPFPLGMVNTKGGVFYLERHPTRKTEQGLTQSMLAYSPLSISQIGKYQKPSVVSVELRDTILNKYPTAQECLTNLLDPMVTNDAAAFHRNFCLVRGPLHMLYLGYKEDVVGVLVEENLSKVRLGRKFGHVKEAVQELGIFNQVL